MSNVTLQFSNGAAEVITLPDNITLPVTFISSSNNTPPVSPPPPPPPVSNVSSNVVASVLVACSNQTVTFTDQTISARPLTSVTVGYGLGGTPKEIGAGGITTKDYPNAGSFNAALVATDDLGKKSTVLLKLTLPSTSNTIYTANTSPPTGGGGNGGGSNTPPSNSNTTSAPVASFTVKIDGMTVSLTDTSTDKDNDITEIGVNWGDGEADADIAAGSTISHTYTNIGNTTILLSVADSTGGTDKTSKTIYVVPANTAVTPSFTISANGLNVIVQDTSVRGSYPLNSASWVWGDMPGSSPSVAPGGKMSHAYDAAGTYPITLSIGDASGSGATLTQNITVSGTKPIPLNIPSPDSITVQADFDDGTVSHIVVNKGACVPFISDDPAYGGVKYYSDGMCIALENMYAGTKGDISGRFTIIAGGTTIFDDELILYAYAGPRPFWLRQPLPVENPDLSLFPKLVPAPNASMYQSYHAADNSPTGYGCDIFSMGTAGEHAHLGPVPQWDACYLANSNPQNTEVMFGMANAARVWECHVRDITTGEMIDVTQYPKISFLQAFRGIKGNPIGPFTTNNPVKLTQAQAHATNFCALAAVIFATEYHKEELAFWSNYYSSLWQNYAYRLPAGCVMASHGIVRGKGRGLTALLYAAKYSSHASYFDNWVRAMAQDYQSFYLKQTGLAIDQTAKGQGYAHGQFAPWQQHLLVYGVGLAVHFGYTEFQPVLDYFATVLFDALLSDGQTPTLQHEFATIYNSGLVTADGTGVVSNWRESIELAGTFNAPLEAGLQCAENSQALQDAIGHGSPGNFMGYPASPTGYAAIARPAHIMTALYATDQIKGQALLQKFLQYDVSDYSNNPKYGLVG